MNITSLYRDLCEGKIQKSFFMRSARTQFPNFISATTSYEDAVKILKGKRMIFENETNSEKTLLNEASTNSGFTYLKNELTRDAIDYVDPYQLKVGVQTELSKMDDISGDNYKLAMEKAVKNLTKDKFFYKDSIIANFKEVKKEDEAREMKPVKATKKTESKKAKVKADGYLKKEVKKDEKENVSAPTKENKKGKPKGVKEMTYNAKKAKGISKVQPATGKEKVIKELKESILKKKVSLKEDTHFDYTVGGEVETPEGHGKVTDIVGGTISVQLDNGVHKDFQINVLDKMKRDAAFGKLPNLGSVKSTDKKDNIISKLREFFSKKKKMKKETLYVDPKNKKARPIVGSSTQTASALRGAGYIPVSGTEDAK